MALKLADQIIEKFEAALEWSETQKENRIRSISQNAVLQAKFPFGRGDDPVTDGDAQAQNDIFLILQRLERRKDVDPSCQHQPLTPVAKPDSDPVLQTVADDLLRPEPEETPNDA